MATINEPNCVAGLPGQFWRVNNAEGRAVARISRLIASEAGPAGWYLTQSGGQFLRPPLPCASEEDALLALTRDAAAVAIASITC